jgi:GT2 family glycosyltransferase
VKFSIIIPTRSRPVQLDACLRSIRDLDYPPEEREVIVVEDGGDGTAVSGARLLRQIPCGGPGRARNLGAAQALGRYLVFTDDDCCPRRNWLQSLDARLNLHPDAMVGGAIRNAIPENPYSAATQVILDFLYQGVLQFFATSSLAVSADAFRELGGFDGAWPLAGGEDREFCSRWVASGRKLILAPDALVDHAHELSFSSFWNQHFRYGRGACWLRRRRRIHAGRPDFYLSLLRYSAAHGYLALVLLAQAATTAGFLRQRFAGR